MISGVTPIESKNETIRLTYQRTGIITQEVQQIIHVDEGQEIMEYHLALTNHIDYVFASPFSTGIMINPAKNSTILIYDESGNVVTHHAGGLGEIILNIVEVPPKGKREYAILITTPTIGEEPFIQQLLQDTAQEWLHNPNALIAAEAEKIWNKIKTNQNPNNWPSIANDVMALEEKIKTENENAVAVQEKWKDIKLNFQKNPQTYSAEQQGWYAVLDERAKKDDWKGVENDISRMELTTIKSPTIDLNAAGEDIQQLGNWMNTVSIKMDKYKMATSITCSKLENEGYYCPIGDDSFRLWKNEMEEIRKNLQRQAKTIAKGTSNHVALQNDAEYRDGMQNTWKTREQNIEEAISQMKKTAEGMIADVKKIAGEDSRQNVQDAISKAEKAIDGKEYGKAIFIAKNLRTFLVGEIHGLDFLNLPLEGWIILFICVGGGFLWYWKEHLEKKVKPIVLSPLPRYKLAVNPRHAQDGSDGRTLPHMQEGDRRSRQEKA